MKCQTRGQLEVVCPRVRCLDKPSSCCSSTIYRTFSRVDCCSSLTMQNLSHRVLTSTSRNEIFERPGVGQKPGHSHSTPINVFTYQLAKVLLFHSRCMMVHRSALQKAAGSRSFRDHQLQAISECQTRRFTSACPPLPNASSIGRDDNNNSNNNILLEFEAL